MKPWENVHGHKLFHQMLARAKGRGVWRFVGLRKQRIARKRSWLARQGKCPTNQTRYRRCPLKLLARRRSEYEPTVINSRYRCLKCGKARYGTRRTA